MKMTWWQADSGPGQIEADINIPSDLRSAKIVQAVANTISPFIKVTIDVPSQHESTFMPFLDIHAKMINDRIVYKFYKNEISKQTVIHASSAIPANTKRHDLVNEGLRRLRLTDRSLPWSEVEDVMSKICNMLRASGYTARSLRLPWRDSDVSAKLQTRARARLCYDLGRTRARRGGTRPGVQQCQAQQIKIFGWMDQWHHSWYLATLLLKVRVDW